MEKELALGLLHDKKFVQLRTELADMNPADIAAFVEEMSELDDFGDRDLTLLYRILPKELAAEVFTYMDSEFQMVLINAFSDKELRDVIDELYIDDTVDIIEEMPANVVSRILKNTDPDTRKEINQLLNYPKDSAGSVMTTEFVYFQKDCTVREAFERIRCIGLVKETVYTCYVTENRKLLGVITLLEMLVADYDTRIEDIMETNVISVNTHDDQETAAQMLSKYDFAAIPVVDSENRIVGILTFDDAMDVIVEENAEDIAMMSAVLPSEKTYLKTSVWTHARNRVVWLLILMLSAALTGAITNHFEAQIAAIPLLVSFMPMIMGTGGNSGSQASTMIIQGMAMDEVHLRDFFRVVFKEFRIALLCSTILAAVNFFRIWITYKDLMIAVVVSVTLIGTVILAKLLGCMLPMLAKKLRIDPALMSAPLLSTLVDSCSMLLYFTIALNLLDF